VKNARSREEDIAVKNQITAALFRLGLIAVCVWMALPAWAHEGDEEPAPPVNPAVGGASNALLTVAAALIIGAGLYTFLLKRGVIKSEASDRWE
jgi:uncharacterized protein HemX